MFIMHLLNFHKLMNNTTEFTIKTLKTDNGTEYTNENFSKYLSENGIKLIHSTPGYPQQNGRSERINQTLNNCATTLLNSAKLPLNFLGFCYSMRMSFI